MRFRGTPGVPGRRVADAAVEHTGNALDWDMHHGAGAHTAGALPYSIVADDIDDADDVDDIDADRGVAALREESWPESQAHRLNPDDSSAGRNRAATAARPLQPVLYGAGTFLDEQSEQNEQADCDNAADAVIIVPPARQQVVLPLPSEKDTRSPGGRQRTTTIGIVRTLLVSLVLYYVLSSSLQLVGASALPLAPSPWAAASGLASLIAKPPARVNGLRMDGKVATRVQPMTQMRRVDLYDSKAQFDLWAGSACSAATLAEILTAYGLPHMTIGRMIREFGADISPQWGLLTYDAFNKVASRYGLRADVYLSNNPLSYKQMLYLTNTLGIPVVVNMRATTGYYHYLSGGHILVMTGGDNSRIRLVDSSLYYMKSLPLSTYNQMARPRNVVIVPKDFHYTLPR